MKLVDIFLTPALSGAELSSDTERYVGLYERAVAYETPPYFLRSYGTSFRLHIENPVWVIQSLISNAVKEGEGSRDLAMVSDACDDLSLTSDLLVHVGDEARHCRMYLQLIDTVFPGAMSDPLRLEIGSQFPPLTHRATVIPKQTPWKMLDYLIQINLGEVRTRIHQKLLEPVLHTYCPDEHKEILCNTLCKLAGDECCHIKYTASRIGALAREFDSKEVEGLFFRRFAEFNRYTERELGSQKDGLFAAPLIRSRC
jgi:hypothetical protein